MKRFLIRAVFFVALLTCAAEAVEMALARANRKSHGKFRIGEDVYLVVEAADAPHPRLITLYLGDSVARQLFHPQNELSPSVLYLPSNQAISMAGQYVLLQKVVEHAPRLRRVCFFYTPLSWKNNLDQIVTHDYFCGYFHSPRMVWDIWNLKHDRLLTEAHIGRLLLPNIMAENSYINRSEAFYGVPIVASTPDSTEPISHVSRYFLEKMKEYCHQRHIALQILPCPCMGAPAQFRGAAAVYDAPITLYDPDLFMPDRIHLKKPNIEPIRRQIIQQFGLSDGN